MDESLPVASGIQGRLTRDVCILIRNWQQTIVCGRCASNLGDRELVLQVHRLDVLFHAPQQALFVRSTLMVSLDISLRRWP